MKIRLRFAAAPTVLTIICLFFTVSIVRAEAQPPKAPAFSANIEWSPQGYIVKGTFTEFPPDIRRAETIYSLDGDTYQTSGEEWAITNWSDGPWTDWNEDDLEKFQNQTCLHSNTEPLKSYLAGKLNRFYVKLRLTRENGTIYDTQEAVIDRGRPMPVPEGLTPAAGFAPSIRVRTFRPFSYYGRYQITVSEDASPEEISLFLPDTLPIEINLQKGIDFVAGGIVDCPVTWKPLADLTLTAGESVTILDAAEEIVIPGGTMLNTPLGIFQLKESLGINQDGLTDEVRLVLNVIAKDSNPSGALACDYNGLDIAFHQKPTGATAIRAYTLAQGESQWTELLNLPLLQAVNAQPSTPGSDYTYVLDNTHELYLSYMAACSEGREPSPFYIGIQIEGGVYDGKKLILPWPDTYELPLELPELGGSGGNENNAGAGNKDDGTAEGQRPNLPQAPEANDDVQHAKPPQNPEINGSGQWEDIQNNSENKGAAQWEDIQNNSENKGAAQNSTGMDTEDRYSAAGSLPNTGTDALTDAPTPTFLPAQINESSSTAPSGNSKDPLPGQETGSSRFLPKVLAAMIAGLCIVILSLVAVTGKRTAELEKKK